MLILLCPWHGVIVNSDTWRGCVLMQIRDWPQALGANLLTLNTLKTHYICFSIRNSTQPDKILFLKYTTMTPPKIVFVRHYQVWYDKTKYLGIILGQNLSWYPYLDLVSKRIRKAVSILKNPGTSNKDLNEDLHCLSSVLTYCVLTRV